MEVYSLLSLYGALVRGSYQGFAALGWSEDENIHMGLVRN